MRFKFAFLCAFGFFFTLEGQEYQGLSADPSAGLYSIQLNPASSAFYPYSYQANILGGHFFGETNYAAVSHTSTISLLRNFEDLDIATHPSRISESGSLSQVIFEDKGNKKYGALSGSVMWPSFMWTKSKTDKMAVYARSRIVGSFFKVPAELGYYEMASVLDNPATIGPFAASYLSWTDLGVHLSRVLIEDNYETSSVGVNARLVLPHESGRFELQDNLTFNRQDSIYSGSGLISSSQYTYFETGGFKPRITGIGLAVDLGYMTATQNESYGFALLDFGFAYVSNGAEAFDIVSDTTITYNNAGLNDPADLNEVISDLDDQLDPQVSRQVEEKSSYSMGLPTALSFQYHRKLSDAWSVTGLLVQRVPFFRRSVRRPNTVSVIPRFKKDQLNIAFPISLFEYREASLGFSIRYWFFTLGTDNLLSFLKQNRYTGTDVYFGMQYYPFRENRKSDKVRCFGF